MRESLPHAQPRRAPTPSPAVLREYGSNIRCASVVPWLGSPLVCCTSSVWSPRYKHRSKARRYHKGFRPGPNRFGICQSQRLGPRRDRVEPTLCELEDARKGSSVGSIESSEDSQPLILHQGHILRHFLAPVSMSHIGAKNLPFSPLSNEDLRSYFCVDASLLFCKNFNPAVNRFRT